MRQAFADAIRAGVDEYAVWYRSYYEANVDDESRPFPMDPAGPRVVLLPGIGIVTSGVDAGKARVARDLYHRAIAVEDAADAIGGFSSLSEPEAFAIEYWPLERYKLAQAPPRGELGGRIALITGGASGIGRATARLLAERGAHVVVADLNVEGAKDVAAELVATHGARRALAVEVDVTDEAAIEDMVRATVLEYGGVDILVASAGLATSAPITETTLADWERNYAVLARGYFLASREAFRVLLRQGSRRLGRVRRVEERARRGGERRRLLVGQGRLAPPRAVPRRGGRAARDPRQHRQSRRRHRRLEHLVIRLEGRAREHLRRRPGRSPEVLPRPHEARSERLPRGRRRGDRVLRRATFGQVNRECRERRRRRHCRVSAMRRRHGDRCAARERAGVERG